MLTNLIFVFLVVKTSPCEIGEDLATIPICALHTTLPRLSNWRMALLGALSDAPGSPAMPLSDVRVSGAASKSYSVA